MCTSCVLIFELPRWKASLKIEIKTEAMGNGQRAMNNSTMLTLSIIDEVRGGRRRGDTYIQIAALIHSFNALHHLHNVWATSFSLLHGDNWVCCPLLVRHDLTAALG